MNHQLSGIGPLCSSPSGLVAFIKHSSSYLTTKQPGSHRHPRIDGSKYFDALTIRLSKHSNGSYRQVKVSGKPPLHWDERGPRDSLPTSNMRSYSRYPSRNDVPQPSQAVLLVPNFELLCTWERKVG
jgi:hypothetical protein